MIKQKLKNLNNVHPTSGKLKTTAKCSHHSAPGVFGPACSHLLVSTSPYLVWLCCVNPWLCCVNP